MSTKRCGCGAEYTRRQWLLLPARGHSQGLDWRDCVHCGSTITWRDRPAWLAAVTLACAAIAGLCAAAAVSALARVYR
jgi:hypothetical protein